MNVGVKVHVWTDTHSREKSLGPIHPLRTCPGICYQISRRSVNDILYSLNKIMRANYPTYGHFPTHRHQPELEQPLRQSKGA